MPINKQEQLTEDVKPPEPAKRTRRMTPEALEKLRLAREKALQLRKEARAKNVDEELAQIKKELRKEKIGDRIHELDTYKAIKEKVETEVKANEIVQINKKLEDLYGKFDGYLADKAIRRQQKEQIRQEKKAKEIVNELPSAIQQKVLEEELKRQEIERFRRKYFGV